MNNYPTLHPPLVTWPFYATTTRRNTKLEVTNQK
jgi:hypothetical protein